MCDYVRHKISYMKIRFVIIITYNKCNAKKCARGGHRECAGGRSHGLPIFLVHDHYLAPAAALGCASDLSEIRSRLGTLPISR